MIDWSLHVPWTMLAQVIVSLIGFILVFIQIQFVIKGIRGSTHDRLYAHYMDVCKIFMEKPHLYPYFYNDKNCLRSKNTGNDEIEVDIMSEILLGLIEHAALQKDNLPTDAWKECWKPFSFERIRNSSELMGYFDKNKFWYTSTLRDLFAEYDRYIKSSSVVPIAPSD